MIPVTKPFLPPEEEYKKLLNGIWQREWLTNMGPLANQLEKELENYLDVEGLLFVTNGTVALQMAIKALNLEGEIVTTPFSFVATTSSIVWENCIPVFVDIDSETLNIDASRIEAAITDKTTAILATHVYGNPCDVEQIDFIAKKHKLKVIYDGAHAFGVKVNGRPILGFGDISTCSLHATKLYHSIEGGLIVCNNDAVYQKLRFMRNFGISGFDTFSELGINGKNSEFHAAMGLANLKYIESIHRERKKITELYDKYLRTVSVFKPKWYEHATLNYAYYPIVFDGEQEVIGIKKILEENQIQTRRYFYPSLARALPYLQSSSMPVTDSISKRVLCLPLYYGLSEDDVYSISQIISKYKSN